jgi:chitinase
MTMKSVLVVLVCSFFGQINAFSQPAKDYKIIAYYTGNGAKIKEYPVEKLTHIIYSFLKIKEDTLTVANEEQEQSLMQIVALKEKYPNLKIMVSIGGWGGCAPCSDLFASEKHRQTFAKTTVAFFKKYNVDGIDLDWEYPTIEGYPGHKYMKEDKDNFTALVKTLRQEMGDKYILTFAAGGFETFLKKSVDWKAIMPHLDFVNLMTYDLTNGYSIVTGHHTPLHSDKKQKESTSKCVNWLLKHKVPAQKLIVGAAFYARIWEYVPDTTNGLYQSGKFKHGIPFKNFDTYFTVDRGFKYYFDEKTQSPYQYSSQEKLFATFDDERSIAAKSKFIQKKKLGGIMFWQLAEDKEQGGLVDAIYKNLKGK